MRERGGVHHAGHQLHHGRLRVLPEPHLARVRALGVAEGGQLSRIGLLPVLLPPQYGALVLAFGRRHGAAHRSRREGEK